MNQPYTEVVNPTNKRGEDKWFIATVVMTLLLAATLLKLLNHGEEPTAIRPPNKLSNLLIQLSNAKDEIAFMQSAQLLANSPSLSELREQQIEPFQLTSISQPVDDCFLIQQGTFMVRLTLGEHGGLAWQNAMELLSEPPEHLCLEEHEHWVSVSNPNH